MAESVLQEAARIIELFEEGWPNAQNRIGSAMHETRAIIEEVQRLGSSKGWVCDEIHFNEAKYEVRFLNPTVAPPN